MSNLKEHLREQEAITAACEAGECGHLSCLARHDSARIDDWEEAAAALTPVHGGKDPDDMNAQRIAWGQRLANECHAMTGTDHCDAVSDAIAYLLHAAPTWGESAEEVLRRAVGHFNAETGEG